MEDSYDLTVVTIATGKYFDYFQALFPRIARGLNHLKLVQIVVFTEAKNLETASSLRFADNVVVHPVKVKPLPWPEITLFRYELLKDSFSEFRGKTVMWLDADMATVNPFPQDVLRTENVSLALHPGYVHRADIRNGAPPNGFVESSGAFLQRLKLAFRRGLWESNRQSAAFAPLTCRKHYFHGAVWLGPRDKIAIFLEELSEAVRRDYERGMIAVWHDESHLNRFGNCKPHSVAVLPPHFSSWRKSKFFSQEEAIYESVDKLDLDWKLFGGTSPKPA